MLWRYVSSNHTAVHYCCNIYRLLTSSFFLLSIFCCWSNLVSNSFTLCVLAIMPFSITHFLSVSSFSLFCTWSYCDLIFCSSTVKSDTFKLHQQRIDTSSLRQKAPAKNGKTLEEGASLANKLLRKVYKLNAEITSQTILQKQKSKTKSQKREKLKTNKSVLV